MTFLYDDNDLDALLVLSMLTASKQKQILSNQSPVFTADIHTEHMYYDLHCN